MVSLVGLCLGHEWGNSWQKSPKGLVLDTSSEFSRHTPCVTPGAAPGLGTINLKKEAGPAPGQASFMHEGGAGVASQCIRGQCHSAPRGHSQCLPMGQSRGSQLHSSLTGERLPRHKCGNQNSCPQNYFAFKIISGAANVVGPSICFEDLV